MGVSMNWTMVLALLAGLFIASIMFGFLNRKNQFDVSGKVNETECKLIKGTGINGSRRQYS
jgi:hypothetical protein